MARVSKSTDRFDKKNERTSVLSNNYLLLRSSEFTEQLRILIVRVFLFPSVADRIIVQSALQGQDVSKKNISFISDEEHPESRTDKKVNKNATSE